MTQVPPTRNSSAIMTRAPWPDAMRAARTPPDPAPITNRSTALAIVSPATEPEDSRASSDQVVPFLFHLRAHFGDHLLGEFVGPLGRNLHALVESFRLFGDQLLTERRLVERDSILELLLGEELCVDP